MVESPSELVTSSKVGARHFLSPTLDASPRRGQGSSQTFAGTGTSSSSVFVPPMQVRGSQGSWIDRELQAMDDELRQSGSSRAASQVHGAEVVKGSLSALDGDLLRSGSDGESSQAGGESCLGATAERDAGNASADVELRGESSDRAEMGVQDGLAAATLRADIFFNPYPAGRVRPLRLQNADLPPIDQVAVMTDEFPDAFGAETGLSPEKQETLIDGLPDSWDELCRTLEIEWASVQHRAIASITRECLARAAAEQAVVSHYVAEAEADVSAGGDQATGDAGAQGSAGGEVTSGEDVDGTLLCPKEGCGKRYGGPQAKWHLSNHLEKVCLPRNGPLLPREKDILRRYDMGECQKCHRWFSRRNVERHRSTCTVGESAGDAQPKPGKYGAHGDEPPSWMKEMLEGDVSNREWLDSVLWADVAPYVHAPHTLRVPDGCREGLLQAFYMPMVIQDLGYEDDADKLHIMMIIMLYAPVYERSVKGDFLSATAAVKSRLERFNNGEWKELWDDAHGHHELDRFSVQRSAAAGKAAKFNRAKHYALQAQFRDAHQALVSPGMLRFSEPGIEAKMHALFEGQADKGDPIMDPPEDIVDDDERWAFVIGETEVKLRHGSKMVETLPYVMQHLPKYKGKGPCGDVYEHYQAMPSWWVSDLCERALNARISEGFASLWRSGLLHVVDKQRVDANGQKDGRPITVGLALRRIVGRVPCAQLKHGFAKLFSSYRQLGIAVPSGIEAAFHTIELSCEAMIQQADGDNSLLPSPVEIDFSDCFTLAPRSTLFANTAKCVPKLLRYMYTCYGGEGMMWGIESGKVVFQSRNNAGVWQGDPLGAHCMGLAYLRFFQLLVEKFKPGSAFVVSDVAHIRPSGSTLAWIIDDLTCVPRQYEALALIDFILAEAPRHKLLCNMDKFHVWIMGKPSDNVEFAAALTARGIKYSYGGLRRLLGAPIGTPSFCVQAEGHLDSLTTAATDFIDQIMQIDHAHAQYLLLRYCATDSLQHCARLKSPTLLRGFASRHRYAVQEAIRNVLHADNLNESQRVQIGLPEYNGGLGCTTTADVLDAAYVGAAGSVARFFEFGGWPEAAVLAQTLSCRADYQAAVVRMNECFQDQWDWDQRRRQAGGEQLLTEPKVMDPARPTLLPVQKDLARAMHRLAATQLADQLERQDPVAASWFHSCSLPGSGSFLHAMPSVQRFRVSSELFRTMLCIRLGAPISLARGLKFCTAKCGYSGTALLNGRHFLSQCNSLCYNTVRHNVVASALRSMLQRAGFRVIVGETADWVIGDPKKRPYDGCYMDADSSVWQGFDVGVADPTRHHYLPTGSRFFKPAQSAARYADKKKGKYTALLKKHALKRKVEFAVCMFEVSGGFSKSALTLLKKAADMADKNKVRLKTGEWSWSAMDFSSYFMQLLSFEINKLSAMAVNS